MKKSVAKKVSPKNTKSKQAKKIKIPKKTSVKKKPIEKVTKKITKKVVVKKIAKKKVLKKKVIKKVVPEVCQVYPIPAKLKRHAHNPILKPSFYSWESKATFNPAAIESNGKVHILYRAIGDDDSSTLGYAYSYDGLNIEDRPTYFAYKRFVEFTKSDARLDYSSGGGWNGGCEDPRLCLLDDMVYMTYTAFDGWGSVRIALTSIKFDDFKKKKWNWKKSVLISPPGEINKNWVIFPEKINGKFAILHSITPQILIDYVDSMDEFDGKKFIKSKHSSKPQWECTWDNMVRGVGPTPLKTDIGWLVMYHAMDKNDPDRYKLGAMILDFKDPTKILYRAKSPILEPDECYENEGWKAGVVYSCGAIIKNGILFVYYGGADKYGCVASIPLKELLDDMVSGKEIKLKNSK